jgi:hypothetical protein
MCNYKFCGWNMVYGIKFLVLSCAERERGSKYCACHFFFFFLGIEVCLHICTQIHVKIMLQVLLPESCGKVENAYIFW